MFIQHLPAFLSPARSFVPNSSSPAGTKGRIDCFLLSGSNRNLALPPLSTVQYPQTTDRRPPACRPWGRRLSVEPHKREKDGPKTKMMQKQADGPEQRWPEEIETFETQTKTGAFDLFDSFDKALRLAATRLGTPCPLNAAALVPDLLRRRSRDDCDSANGERPGRPSHSFPY